MIMNTFLICSYQNLTLKGWDTASCMQWLLSKSLGMNKCQSCNSWTVFFLILNLLTRRKIIVSWCTHSNMFADALTQTCSHSNASWRRSERVVYTWSVITRHPLESKKHSHWLILNQIWLTKFIFDFVSEATIVACRAKRVTVLKLIQLVWLNLYFKYLSLRLN